MTQIKEHFQHLTQFEPDIVPDITGYQYMQSSISMMKPKGCDATFNQPHFN